MTRDDTQRRYDADDTPPAETHHVVALRPLTLYTTERDAEEYGVGYTELPADSNPAKRAAEQGETAVRVTVRPGEVVLPSAGWGCWGLIRPNVAALDADGERVDDPAGPSEQSVSDDRAAHLLDVARQRLRHDADDHEPTPPSPGPEA
ncbi:hypothetical protein [Halomarina rubra]|uniref:Uncharacterized protein n=1 Tax=Halomarina rubra TaxID=2071873 RepID=A0ABD6AU16_9EURY|nr:hypothetical protein [Halomarina rubra]